MKNQIIPKRDNDQRFTLYDNIINDFEQRELQKNLGNFIECQKLYNEILAKGKQKIDAYNLSLTKVVPREEKKVRCKAKNLEKFSNQQAPYDEKLIEVQVNFILLRLCEQVFTSVLLRVHKIIQEDEDEYCIILIKLVVEGALRMFEPQLKIRCLPNHLRFVERIIQDSEETFNEIMKEETGRNYPLSLKINKADCLEQRELSEKIGHEQFSKKREGHQCIGGIILSDATGNITYKNTIDTRINILKEISLPAIRTSLWPSYQEADRR